MMEVDKITTRQEKLEITRATIPSVKEARNIPLRLRKYRTGWWLRDPGTFAHYYAAFVTCHGCISELGLGVYSDSACVRPILYLRNLNASNFRVGDSFYFGGLIFTIISRTKAFCVEDIEDNCFCDDWKGPLANYYGYSCAKAVVDSWFTRAKEAKNHKCDPWRFENYFDYLS